ncbi:MAG TPA: hypothetical protein VF948_03110 [Methylomirabilota bacterium]
MKPGLAAMCLWAALAAPAEASDPVVVLQETRTPVVSKKHRGIQHVVLLKNVSPYSVRGLRVTVEFYDFFDKLLLVRRGAPVPSSLRPGDTATLSLPVPALEAARKTRYRFEYAGGPPHGGRPGPRRGGGVPAGKGRPTEPKPSSP